MSALLLHRQDTYMSIPSTPHFFLLRSPPCYVNSIPPSPRWLCQTLGRLQEMYRHLYNVWGPIDGSFLCNVYYCEKLSNNHQFYDTGDSLSRLHYSWASINWLYSIPPSPRCLCQLHQALGWLWERIWICQVKLLDGFGSSPCTDLLQALWTEDGYDWLGWEDILGWVWKV